MDNIKEFNSASNKGGNKKIVIILGILIAISAALYVRLQLKYNKQEEVLTEAIEERVSVTSQYESLLDDYESLETSNDSISDELLQEKEKIKELIAEIKTVKANNRYEITKYKKELKTLRNIMKGFIHQIDSLNTLNIQLTEENKEIKQQYNTARKENKQLQTDLDVQKEMVAIASVIKAVGINVEAYSAKGKLTNRAKKAKRFAVSFILDENKVAPTGVKSVFIRVSNPNKLVLMPADQPMFKYQDEEIAYSSIREIEYNGEATNATIYYEHVGDQLVKGSYQVDIFCDGTMVGAATTELK